MSKSAPAPWVEGLTIPLALDRTVERYGDRDALVFPKLGLRWSYREFANRVDQVARGLLGLGIKTGEHVAIWATNVPEWVLMQFATARIGAVLVTINPAYRAHELKYVLKQSDSVALVLTDRFKTSDYFAMLAEVCPECTQSCEIKSVDFPKLRHVIAIKGEKPVGTLAWADLVAAGESVHRSQLEAIGKTL